MRVLLRVLLQALLLLLLTYCDGNVTSPGPIVIDAPSGPSGPSSPSTPSGPPATLPLPNFHNEFHYDQVRGFSLFAGTRATEDEIRELFSAFRMQWPHLRTMARVCAEVQSWPNDVPWLPRGVTAKPYDATSPAYKELANFLAVTAGIHNAQVLLVPICNLKEDGTSPANRKKWVRNVCTLAATYNHVGIEVANEFIHPNSDISLSEMRALIRECRAAGPNLQIGTDTNINEQRRAYEPTLAGLVDYFSFHPWRNPDPTKEDLRDLVRQRIGRVIISEPTAYAAPTWGRLGGCCTPDLDQITDYARHTEKAGGIFVQHSVWGLAWPTIGIGPIIPRGDWEIRQGK